MTMGIASRPYKYMPAPVLTDPAADEWTQPFWDAARDGQLVAPRCVDCGRFRMPPGRFCIDCLSQRLEYVPLAGTGAVFSYVVIRQPARPELADCVPYIPVVVDPDGAPGIRFVSNIVDCEPEDVRIGMPVRVVWHELSDLMTVPLWTPV